MNIDPFNVHLTARARYYIGWASSTPFFVWSFVVDGFCGIESAEDVLLVITLVPLLVPLSSVSKIIFGR